MGSPTTAPTIKHARCPTRPVAVAHTAATFTANLKTISSPSERRERRLDLLRQHHWPNDEETEHRKANEREDRWRMEGKFKKMGYSRFRYGEEDCAARNAVLDAEHFPSCQPTSRTIIFEGIPRPVQTPIPVRHARELAFAKVEKERLLWGETDLMEFDEPEKKLETPEETWGPAWGPEEFIGAGAWTPTGWEEDQAWAPGDYTWQPASAAPPTPPKTGEKKEEPSIKKKRSFDYEAWGRKLARSPGGSWL